jgi:hypothetical protein
MIFEIIGRPLMEQRRGFRSLVPLADLGVMGLEVMNIFSSHKAFTTNTRLFTRF